MTTDTLDAFRRAGFKVLGMVNEPTAAAIEFAHRNLVVHRDLKPDNIFLVRDSAVVNGERVKVEALRRQIVPSICATLIPPTVEL